MTRNEIVVSNSKRRYDDNGSSQRTHSNAHNHHLKAQVGCIQNGEDKNQKDPAPAPSYVYKDMSNIKAPPNYRCLIRWDPENSSQQKLPVKLDAMLSDPALSAIITFLPHGRSWRIINRKQMAKFVLPQYFDHSNLDSFLRLVNAWGFRRVPSGVDRDSYYHELFLRGMPHLHTEMKRLTRDQAKSPVLLEDQCPNFYEMPPLPDGPKHKGNDDKNDNAPPSNKKANPTLMDMSTNLLASETNNFKMHSARKYSQMSSLTDDTSDSTPVPSKIIGNDKKEKKLHPKSNSPESVIVTIQTSSQPQTSSAPIQNQNLIQPATSTCNTLPFPQPIVFLPNRNQTLTFQHLQFPTVCASAITPSPISQLPPLNFGAQQGFAACNQPVLQFTPPTVGQQPCSNMYSTTFLPSAVTSLQQPNLYSACVPNLLHQLASLLQSNVSRPTSSHQPPQLNGAISALLSTQQPNAGNNLADNETRYSGEIAWRILCVAAEQQGRVSSTFPGSKP